MIKPDIDTFCDKFGLTNINKDSLNTKEFVDNLPIICEEYAKYLKTLPTINDIVKTIFTNSNACPDSRIKNYELGFLAAAEYAFATLNNVDTTNIISFKESPEILSGLTLATRENFVVDKDHTLIFIHGDVEITSAIPINITDNVKSILIYGNGTLTLNCKENQQPCIGSLTHTGMSFGRWSPIPCSLQTIYIRGNVTVKCNSLEENFSIGAYGYEEYPEIDLGKRASIICPEATGRRMPRYLPEPPSGSTKISESASYIIVDDISKLDDEDLIPDEIKKIRDDFPEKYRHLFKYNTPYRRASKAAKLYDMYGDDIDIEPILRCKDSAVGTAAAILHIDAKDVKNMNEAQFELLTRKCDVLKNYIVDNIYSEDEIIVKLFYTVILFIITNCYLTPYVIRFCYEMIPAYCFCFNSSDSITKNVTKYLEATSAETTPYSFSHLFVDERKFFKDKNLPTNSTFTQPYNDLDVQELYEKALELIR